MTTFYKQTCNNVTWHMPMLVNLNFVPYVFCCQSLYSRTLMLQIGLFYCISKAIIGMNIISGDGLPIIQIANCPAYYSKNYSRIFCPGLLTSCSIELTTSKCPDVCPWWSVCDAESICICTIVNSGSVLPKYIVTKCIVPSESIAYCSSTHSAVFTSNRKCNRWAVWMKMLSDVSNTCSNSVWVVRQLKPLGAVLVWIGHVDKCNSPPSWSTTHLWGKDDWWVRCWWGKHI